MELNKKTTILLPPDLHDQLSALAKQQKVSVGHLIRSACRKQYFAVTDAERLEAVEQLRRLSLPVSSVRRMKRESVTDPTALMP